MSDPSPDDLLRENEQLRQRLEEAESIVRAISKHEVDAFVVQSAGGDEGVLVLDGVDKPYRLLIERMQQGAAILNSDGIVVYANGRLSELLEETLESLRGTTFASRVRASDRNAFSKLLEKAPIEDVEREVRLVRGGETEFFALLNVTPLRDRPGVLCLIVTDLTQQKRYAVERERLIQEQAAREAAERVAEVLRTADRRKDEFLAMLGHELRNPLAPLRNGLEILNVVGSQEPAARRTREMMGRQLDGLIRMVDDLLDVGRVTQGKIELQKEPADLRQVVTRALESGRTVIDERGHSVELRLPEDPVPVEADLVRLTQVITNILNNAAKFTPRGGRIQIVIGSDPTLRQAEVRIRDDGMGIAPEMQSRIFELFAQADPTVGRTEGGLGIGLTLAHRLVEMHGGALVAASEGIGRGSEFCVRLPLLERPIAVKEARVPVAVEDAQRPVRRILVVDDNQDSAESLSMLLGLFGHDVRKAYDGQTALELIGEFVPELLLLDIGLPGMDGYEVARRVRSHPQCSAVRLVALSGYGSDEARIASHDAGFDDHLVKPVEISSIRSLLASMSS